MTHTGSGKVAGQLNVQTTAPDMVSVMIQLMFHSVQTVNKAGLELNVILDVMANKYQWIVVCYI